METVRGRLKGFTISLWLMLGLLVAFTACFTAYVRAEGQIKRTHETRYQALLLAEQLLQSSDDLTTAARLYVATGNPMFRTRHQDILDVRDGKKPRPIEYRHDYWDLLHPGLSSQAETGPAAPLLELIGRAGFTEPEMAQLALAKTNSDALSQIEVAVMATIELVDPSIEARRATALTRLNDAAYLAAKAAVMRPISEFNRMAHTRTLLVVQTAERDATGIRNLLVVLGLLALLLLWRVHTGLQAILGGSPQHLYMWMARLGRGEVLTSIPVPNDRADSVLGWLSKMQTSFAGLELHQFKAIVNSTDDAIVGKTLEGTITSWNASAERIFGYRADEAIGQSMRLLIPPDRQNEEVGILARIAAGERVEHFETVRRRKDGQLIDVSVAISPIIDGRGQVIGASKIVRDITERKRTDDLLREHNILLARQKVELELALGRVSRLEGLISMCMYCKKIRTENDWHQLERYLTEHSDAVFSHGLCPDCYEREMKKVTKKATRKTT